MPGTLEVSSHRVEDGEIPLASCLYVAFVPRPRPFERLADVANGRRHRRGAEHGDSTPPATGQRLDGRGTGSLCVGERSLQRFRLGAKLASAIEENRQLL